MTERIRIGWMLVLACLAMAGCLSGSRSTIPLTTSEEQALEAFVEGRDELERMHFDKARRLLARAVREDPTFALAHFYLAEAQTSSPEFFQSLERAVALADGASKGERLMILGRDAGVRGDVDGQTAHYEEMVELYPDDERAQSTLGLHYYVQLRFRDAARRFERATELARGYAPAHNLLGYAASALEDYDRAQAAFERYIELAPDEPNAHDSHAELLMKRGRFEESIAGYEKALSLDPEFVPSRVGIGNNLIFLGRIDEALTEFGKIHEAAQDDAERRQALFWIAVTHLHTGAHDDAIEALQRSAEIARLAGDLPAAAADLGRIGDVLREKGDYRAAQIKYLESVETVEQADVPDEVITAAKNERLYKQVLVTLAKPLAFGAAAKTRDYRNAVGASANPLDRRRLSELLGTIRYLEGDARNALPYLAQADVQNPRVIYITALALRDAGFDERARQAGERAANFNGPSFDYAFVRAKAQRLLVED